MLAEAVSTPVRRGAEEWQIEVHTPREDGSATVVLRATSSGAFLVQKEQPVCLVPAGFALDAARLETYARGILTALARCDTDRIMPCDLFRPAVLELPDLPSPEQIAQILLDPDAQRAVLGGIEVDDFGRSHALPLLEDSPAKLDVWTLMSTEDHGAAELAAHALAAARRVETVPYLLCLVEGWAQRMERMGGRSWIVDGRNIDVVLARILAPLLRELPEVRARVAALETLGVFDEAHQTTPHPS
jgi:hypothetical protein